MKKMLLGYVGAQATVSQEDGQKLTHIHLAFGKVYPDGSVQAGQLPVLEQLEQLRCWNPGLRCSVSLINGDPQAFTTVCGDPKLRQSLHSPAGSWWKLSSWMGLIWIGSIPV